MDINFPLHIMIQSNQITAQKKKELHFSVIQQKAAWTCQYWLQNTVCEFHEEVMEGRGGDGGERRWWRGEEVMEGRGGDGRWREVSTACGPKSQVIHFRAQDSPCPSLPWTVSRHPKAQRSEKVPCLLTASSQCSAAAGHLEALGPAQRWASWIACD